MFRSFALSLLLAGAALAADPGSPTWPQWRGPNRDGGSPGAPWPATFSATNFNQVWKVEKLGPSYSGPIVTEDRVFTTETVDKKTEVVRCLDRKTGKELWKQEWDGAMKMPFFAARNGDWIRSTPAYDGESLFVGGIRDVLVCLDAKTGKEKWKVDFVEKIKSPLPAFGFVCSPLVDDTGVYVQAGAALVKLNKKTGETIWRTLEEKDAMMGSAFASPTFGKLAGKDQLLVQTRTKLAGVDKEKGTLIWEKEIPSFRGMNILTPVQVGEGVFTSTYGGNTRLLNVLGEAGKAINTSDAWSFKYEGNMTTPVIVDGHAYLLGKDRRFVCVNLKDGKEAWRTEERFGEYWNLVARGDKLLALDNRGKLFLIKANPQKFELLDQREVSKAETWAHLAVVGDEIFIRDLEGITAYQWK